MFVFVLGMLAIDLQAATHDGAKLTTCSLVATRLWTDREPEFLEMNKYSERPALGPSDIAEVMLKMVEGKEYTGGTVVLKTPLEERIIEEGYDKQAGTYDPSPRPAADLTRIKGIIERERGVKWNPELS